MLQEGGGVASIIGGILNILTGLFGGAGPNLLNAISGIGNISFSTLQLGAGFLRDTVTSLRNIFKALWDKIIVAFLTKLLRAFIALRNFLRSIFGPIIKWLKRIRAWYDAYFNKFVKPFLKILRQVRQFLQIFRLLGFKWAARLDARLADIENKIVKAYELLRQNLNRVISWIDLIVDPTFLLRRNPLFGAIIRSAHELNNLMLQTVSRPLTPAESDKQAQAKGRYTLAGYKQRQADSYAQGNLPADAAASLQDFRSKATAFLNS